jgi:hypothetical protein
MAAVVDLNGLKDNLRSLFDTANTTTASPIDLSSGLSKRVQHVLSLNPQMLVPQASFFPLVTCYVSGKDRTSDDIGGSQLTAKRAATIEMKVIGSVWNSNFSQVEEDPADEDINHLMENIELILRSDVTLGGKVNWQIMDNVEYYATVLNEESHLRSGILTMQCKVWY